MNHTCTYLNVRPNAIISLITILIIKSLISTHVSGDGLNHLRSGINIY